MKNSTITYIVMLGISIISPLILFPDIDYYDDWVAWLYRGGAVIGIATIIIAFLKDKTSKHLTLPILSIFILLISITQLFLGISILGSSYPRNQTIDSEALLPLFVLFQIFVIILTIKHILPQKIEEFDFEAYETIEM